MLSLSKVGRIAVRLHRPLVGTPKTVTSSREADGWYASVACAEVLVEPLPLTGRETGIDMGLTGFSGASRRGAGRPPPALSQRGTAARQGPTSAVPSKAG